MTPQEALEALKIEQIVIEGKAVRVAKFFEGISVANEALEKQIPKKVVEKKFVEDVSLNYCPCCNVRFIGWGMKHCGECGQALDWSDTE